MSAIASRTATARAEEPSQAALRPWRTLSIATAIDEIAAEWRDFEARALLTPYQAYGWVRPFVETVGAAHGMDFRYVLLRDAQGALLALLPLVLTRRSGVRFAEFIGGKHANYHMGLYEPRFAAALDTGATRAMLSAIDAAIGGLDAFVFANQPVSWQGMVNPLATLAAAPSPSGAYKLALAPGDGEATLKRSMSRHAQKKLKNKRNRFAEFGPSRLVRAREPQEIANLVDSFLAQKAARFQAMGAPDPFADPALRHFLEAGALAGDGSPPVLELYALELNGSPVATYVGAVQGGRFSGMATSFEMDSPAARTSPGEILLVDLIKLKCRDGLSVFDLGVGEARYKTTICDEHDELVDSFVPLTAKGHAFAVLSRAKRAAKRRIKQSPLLLKLARRASLWLKRPPSGPADE